MTVLNSTLNNLPGRSDGWIVPGDPASAAIALPVDVPSVTLNIADRLSVAGTLDTAASAPGRQVWRWRLTAAQVTTALGTPAETVMVPWRATTGVGDDLSPLAAGELRVVSKWTAGYQQMFGSALVLIGPPGASTAEAEDARDAALLAQAAAEDARDAAQDIADTLGGTPDGAVAALVDDPDSATREALSSTFDALPSRRRSRVAATRTLTVDGASFFVRGANLGIISTWAALWAADWDYGWHAESLEWAAQAGFNTIRASGVYEAYAANPALVVARHHQIFEKCRSLGLKIMFDFINGASPTEPLSWATHSAGYQQYVTDVITPYAGDPLILTWGAGNELDSTNPGHLAIISGVTSWIRTVDPAAVVSASQTGNTITELRAKIFTTEPYVDVHEIHCYYHPSADTHGFRGLQQLVDMTARPVIVGEIGVASTSGVVRVGSPEMQAAQLQAFARQAIFADIAGVAFWKLRDSATNTTKMGLFDESGVPLPQLDVAMRYPDSRIGPAVRDAIISAPQVVLLDNFNRPAGVSLGAPSIGPTGGDVSPAVWGIHADGGAYPTTRSGAVDKVIYQMRQLNTPLFETEFLANSSGCLLYLYVDWLDANNTNAVRLSLAESGDLRVFFLTVKGGVLTDLGGRTFVGFKDAEWPRRIRLSVASTDVRHLHAWLNGSYVGKANRSDLSPKALGRGFGIGAADTTSRVIGVRDFAEGRIA